MERTFNSSFRVVSNANGSGFDAAHQAKCKEKQWPDLKFITFGRRPSAVVHRRRGPAAKSKWDGSRRIERGNKKYIQARRGRGGGGGRGSAENDFFACVLRSSNSFTRPLGCCFLVSRIIDNCRHVSKVDERSELYCETVWLNIMGGIKICVSLFTWWYNFRIFIKLFCWLDIFEIESLFFKAIWINK